jgi:RNA polymerase sigma-70 factor (ECF subfamily)
VYTQVVAATDAQLIRRAHEDSEALATLYLRYRDRLYAWFRARAPEAAASELTAELFAQVALGLKRFRDEADGSAAPWLYGIAKNLLRRYHEQESQNGKGSRA